MTNSKINSVSDLHDGSVVVDSEGDVWTKHEGAWHSPSSISTRPYHYIDDYGPFTVLREAEEPVVELKAMIYLFKPSGKYYTNEEWRIPADAIGPYDMRNSPDFRRIDGGAVLVPSQEPWGFPHLIPSVEF